MSDKNWIIYLSEDCHILVFLYTEGPRVVGFAVVLVATINGEKVSVTRFDTAHGQAHRDVLGRKGDSLKSSGYWI